MLSIKDARIGILGLGYVGLPLAVEFGKRYPTVGFDINAARIAELEGGTDSTLEVDADELALATRLEYSCETAKLADCNVFIVTVPTPIDRHNQPDLRPLQAASQTLAGIIKQGDIVIYESTVFPGATEEVCIPIIEQGSGLTYNQDFYAGYSPERINPGDKEHRVTSILKVTSGSTPEVADFVDQLYASIITAGTYKAESIKVAEAAKVIENTQRDVNIALVNELAHLFNKIGIDTEAVLKAAGTKWNFLPFRPGLVGGHCIGVDPYYLTYKAREFGHEPEMILAGRRINSGMGSYVAKRLLQCLARKRIHVSGARILVLGLAFKENCPDIRNTRVTDVISELEQFDARIDVHDPWVEPDEANHEYGISLVKEPADGTYDAIVLAVAHQQYAALGPEAIRRWGKPDSVLFDVKYLFPADSVDGRL